MNPLLWHISQAMTFLARHYQTGETLHIEVTKNCYSSIRTIKTAQKLPFIAPGLVDIQINGFSGIDFNQILTQEAWQKACSSLYAKGCTHFLATLITDFPNVIEKKLANLEDRLQQNPYNCIGYHLEGPFLNSTPGYTGVHSANKMILCNLSWLKKWQQITHQKIRLITLAPETHLQKALAFIRYAVKKKIRIALGHSSLTGKAFEQAVRAGATGWTHLGNGLAQQIHKFENPLFYALVEPKLFCSLIPDGIHLPKFIFSSFTQILQERVLLTTDATAAAAAPQGKYSLGSISLLRNSRGEARETKTHKLAGSTLTPFEAVFSAARLANNFWPQMWEAFSTRPAQWLGITNHDIKKGNKANFCLFWDTPRLLATVHQGQCVFGKIPSLTRN